MSTMEQEQKRTMAMTHELGTDSTETFLSFDDMLYLDCLLVAPQTSAVVEQKLTTHASSFKPFKSEHQIVDGSLRKGQAADHSGVYERWRRNVRKILRLPDEGVHVQVLGHPAVFVPNDPDEKIGAAIMTCRRVYGYIDFFPIPATQSQNIGRMESPTTAMTRQRTTISPSRDQFSLKRVKPSQRFRAHDD